MNKRPARMLRRGLVPGRRVASWAALFGERQGKEKAWTCTFCGVIGSHRRGCHYVTQAHHRERKRLRRGRLGALVRAARSAAGHVA